MSAGTDTVLRPVMPELDFLRGIAILLVLIFHGFLIPGGTSSLSRPVQIFHNLTQGGWTGVYLFFVLSGFLITGILLDSKPRKDYYRRFYIRRALRILPAFYLLLVALAILPRTGWLEGRRVGWPFLALSFFYLSNVTSLFGVPGQYAPLWSLAVEEHFYMVWPAVIRVLNRRAVAWCAAGIVAASPLIRAITYWLGYNSGTGYTWLVADGLALGAVIGVLIRGPLAERQRLRAFGIICGLLGVGMLIFGAPYGIWRSSTFAGGVFRQSAVNAVFAGTLIATLLLGTSPLKKVVTLSPVRFYGEISYGLYLYHMLVFDFINRCVSRFLPGVPELLQSHFGLQVLRFLAGAGLATGLAFASRRFFEDRFLRLKEALTPSIPTSKHRVEVIAVPDAERQTAQAVIRTPTSQFPDSSPGVAVAPMSPPRSK